MNGMAVDVPKRVTSPRPPTEGEEIKRFHESVPNFPEPYKNYSYANNESNCMASFSNHRDCTTPVGQGYEEVGQQAENTPHSSPPPCFKWAQDLSFLITDKEGVALFKQFLEHEGQDTKFLDFCFACAGIKKCPGDAKYKFIKAVFRTYIKHNKQISNETKDEIHRKIDDKTSCDPNIFDAAQREMEDYIAKTIYPNFFKSDIYIDYLRSYPNKNGASAKEGQENSAPEMCKLLPTVHEDSELQINANSSLMSKETWPKSKFSEIAKIRPEAYSGLYMRTHSSCYSAYHSKYSSFLPASAQDSELQSLSSDAQTDDTMSQTDSSMDCGPIFYNRFYKKKEQRAAKHNAALNKDNLAQSTFIPRTHRLPPEYKRDMSPKEFHALLVDKLNRHLDDLKAQKRISEKLQSVEGDENSPKVFDSVQTHPRPPSKILFGPNFFSNSEESEQEILDRHVSRVWNDSAHQTPTLSPGYVSPMARPSYKPVENRVPPCRPAGCEAMSEQGPAAFGFAHKMGHNPQLLSVHNNVARHRRDHDARSSDSGTVQDFALEEALSASYKTSSSTNVSFEQSGITNLDHHQNRRHRDQSRRSTAKKITSAMDSSSSCVDSGVSVVCNSLPVRGSVHEKVANWLDSKKCGSDVEKEYHKRNSSTSPVLSRSGSSRKPVAYSNSRCGTLDGSSVPWSSQTMVQDTSLPVLSPPDTTTQLVEASRRLEDEHRSKINKMKFASGGKACYDAMRMKSRACDFQDDSYHRKQSRKSCPGMIQENVNVCGSNEMTVIGYCYGRHSVPYLSKIPGRHITLKQFKSLLSKKGNFRYFFKKASNDFGTGVVFEEVTDDNEILPLWEGKVFSVIESVE